MLLFRFFSIILRLVNQKSLNLVIDIGNTCAKLVAFEDGEPIEEERIENDEPQKIKDFCNKFSFERGIYSSVIDLSRQFVDIIISLPFSMMELQPGVTDIPIINKYKTPHTLGSDRLAAVIGANYLNPQSNILIIDIGTCVTYDFINASGEYLGGNISPGPTMRIKALNKFTARLPIIERNGSIPEIGTSTETAIRSGITNGIRYEIEGYISKFSVKYPGLFIYLTGGVDINLHIPEKMRIFANKFIVPIGLNRILEYNNE